MKNKNTGILILSVVCVLLLCGVAYTFWKDKEVPDVGIEEESQSDVIIVDGVKYKPNRSIQAVLFMGIDKEKIGDLGGRPGEHGQSDSLNLLIADRETKKAQILQISRDCMVDIDIYSITGEKMMSEPGQISLQYAYGDGDKLSCRVTTEKVADLLYGIDIPYYLSLTLEGMSKAADVIGGVTLEVPEDYSAIDPAFVKGQTVTLDAGLVEKYVRSRDTEVLESNADRMQRQAQFMAVLIEKLQTAGNQEEYLRMYQELEPYMVTNMMAEDLLRLAEYDIASTYMEIPGEIILKDGHAQFIVDNKSLKKIILETFYKPC